MTAAIPSEFSGPWVTLRNLAADLKGSIHDDQEAKRLGLPAAVIGANVLLANLTPVLVSIFGKAWYERGFFRLTFLSPVHEGGSVRVQAATAAPLPGDDRSLTIAFVTAEGEVAASGIAGLLTTPGVGVMPWERDAAPPPSPSSPLSDPLPGDEPGMVTESGNVSVGTSFGEDRRAAAGDDSPWYRQESPWGGPIVASNSFHRVGRNVRSAAGGQRRAASRAVMNSTLQLVHMGPMFCDQEYGYREVLIDKGMSGKTAYRTLEYAISTPGGETIAVGRQRQRWFPRSD